MDTKNIDGLLEEIKYLKNKAKLLDEILRYYDNETMNINIPDKWKVIGRLGEAELNKIPKSPRHSLNKRIYELLPSEESEKYVNLDKMDEKAND